MSHTSTTELSLRKDGADEAVANFRGVMNDNMDLIDAAYGQSLENIAAIEGATASAAHAVGTYLVQNGILYRVTSAIAIGDTITPGTNVTATDLNTAVTSLNTAASNLTSSLAAVEQTTATANHAIGDYFMLGNVLMQATAAIATGEQISVSNATPATLQSQINSLRDSVGNRVTFVTGQSVSFDNSSTNNEVYKISSKCVNSANTTLYNHNTSFIVKNSGIVLHDNTASKEIWKINSSIQYDIYPSGTNKYFIFASTPKTAGTGYTTISLIMTGIFDYGTGYSPIFLVNIKNRDGVGMTVKEMFSRSIPSVIFGMYTDGDTTYYGAKGGPYSAAGRITVLNATGSSPNVFVNMKLSSEPTGWTTVNQS